MTHFDQMREDLQNACMGIEAMRNAGPDQLKEFEKGWTEYLMYLELVWYKFTNLAKNSPEWKSWLAGYKKMREDDPLLAYLHIARGSRTHSFDQITERAIGLPWNSVGKRVLDLHIAYNADDTVQSMVPKGFHYIHEVRLQVQLRPVTSEEDKRKKKQGKVYPVPEYHLGRRVHSWNPVQIAELGLQFYSDLIGRAEKENIPLGSAS
jgi:hypothetical protein